MIRKVCGTCRVPFNSLFEETGRSICYGCALQEFTGGKPPEEGDFNSARLVSGEMTEKEWKWLQEDLRAAEEGRSIREFEEPEYVCFCSGCGGEESYCYCDSEESNS